MMYNENDTNILIIRRILGHKSLSATEIYTHVSPKKLRDIMENCTISSILEQKNKEELNQWAIITYLNLWMIFLII